jgi:alanine racemase
VVKANAYGHGIGNAYAGLKGADGFALLDRPRRSSCASSAGAADPAARGLLRSARPRHLLAPRPLAHVHHERQIDWLAAHKTAEPHKVFLKLNSGMNRLGFAPRVSRRVAAPRRAAAGRPRFTLMTHLANCRRRATAPISAARSPSTPRPTAELPGPALGLQQRRDPAHRRRLAPAADDWVRPGILLYGSSPDHPLHRAADWGLGAGDEPARRADRRCRRWPPVRASATARAYTAERELRIGVVACGYADGYPRLSPGSNERGTPVLVDGVRTRTVGRVSMDMITVDLSPVPQAHVGSVATLWGRAEDGAVLSIDEVAQASGTVGYELMCARAPRVPIRVVGA